MPQPFPDLLLCLLPLGVCTGACAEGRSYQAPADADSGGTEAPGDLAASWEASPAISTVGSLRITGTALEHAQVLVFQGDTVVWEGGADAVDGVWERVIIGLPPGQELHTEVRARVDGVQRASWRVAGPQTGLPPAELPAVQTTGDASGVDEFMVASVLSVPAWAAVLGPQGQWRWWWQSENAGMITRVRMSAAGDVVWVLAPLGDGLDQGSVLLAVSIDGTQSTEVMGQDGVHHDFVELPDGILGVIEHDVRTVEGEEIKGDRIVEISPDGTRREVWNAWDHIPYDPDQSAAFFDWIHANALDFEAEEDAYYLSLAAHNSIWRIDRADGQVGLKLGGALGEWPTAEGQTLLFERQHQFQRVPGGLLVFDNGAIDQAASRVVEWHLDEDTQTARMAWSHATDPPVFSHGLGDVARRDDGHTRVVWSAAGQVDEVDGEGALVWQRNFAVGGGIGYTTWLDALGPP